MKDSERLDLRRLFETWATGFSGCDGGNPNQSIWLCGIEPGGGFSNTGPDLTSTLKLEFLKNVIHPPQGWLTRNEYLKHGYNIRCVKLLSEICGVGVESHQKFSESYLPFSENSNFFKLNLYPVSVHSTCASHWGGDFLQLFNNRTEYLNWCRTHRFKQMNRWVKKYNPRIIIGTGITWSKDFKDAFSETSDKNSFEEVRVSAKKLLWKPIDNDKTLLFVIPFLGGPNGLNSDALLKEFGVTIKNTARMRGIRLEVEKGIAA